MKNKINIAEILKDCPKGMELDCASYDNVSFDKISDDKKATYPIFCYITDKEGNRSSISFTENGCESKRYGAKCVIFPKGKTTWEGFVPPCKFKDGDIIADSYFDTICIFKGEGRIRGTVNYYCGINDSGVFFIKDVKDQDEYFGEIEGYNFATEEEKQKLFDAIKANDYRWNKETKTLEKLIKPKFKVGDRIRLKENHNYIYTITGIREKENKYECGVTFVLRFGNQDEWELVPNKFDITTLKPFESRVLVRVNDCGEWRCAFWGHLKRGKYMKYDTIRGIYKQCIPYENNEHLLGTTNDCDEYYKTWK